MIELSYVMSKKTSSVSAIDHFFHQRKDTFQTIGHYGLFWIRIVSALVIVGLIIAFILGARGVSSYPINYFVMDRGGIKTATILFFGYAVVLSGLFRRYAKGDVFSMKNTGFLVALGTFQCIVWGSPVVGILLLAVAVVVPSHDVDTPAS